LTKLRETSSATAQFERVSREYGLVDEVLEGAAACLYAIPQENDIDTTDRVALARAGGCRTVIANGAVTDIDERIAGLAALRADLARRLDVTLCLCGPPSIRDIDLVDRR
jgi:hypothetical protein